MTAGMQMLSAEGLRAEFDRAFAEPARVAATGSRDFVLVATAPGQWALPLDGICGIEQGLPVVRLPSSRASLLGIAGVRGVAVPVFSLAALAGVQEKAGGWQERPMFALLETGVPGSGTGQRVSVAFERLVQFARVQEEDVFGGEAGAAFGRSLRHAGESHADELYTIVESGELLRRILGTAAAGATGGAARDGLSRTQDTENNDR